MKEDIEELRANVERTEMAGLTFIATRAACARAALDYIAELEQTSRAQRTTEWESAAPVGREFAAAGQAGLAKLLEDLTRPYGVFDVALHACHRDNVQDFLALLKQAKEARVALAAPVAADTEQAIPEGYKLVPLEPTPEMYNAACHAYHAWRFTTSEQPDWTHRDTYRAMLSAAPTYAIGWDLGGPDKTVSFDLATPADAGAGQNDEQLRETDGYKLGWMEGMQEGAELATGGEKTAADVEAEFADLLPGSYYMDPPDGGSPSVLEQVSRMAEDAAQWRAHIASLGQSSAPVTAEPVASIGDAPGFENALFQYVQELTNPRGNLRAYAKQKEKFISFIDGVKLATPAPADRDAIREAQVNAIRDQALDVAAIYCDKIARDWSGVSVDGPNAADECAATIRTLKSMERAAGTKGDA